MQILRLGKLSTIPKSGFYFIDQYHFTMITAANSGLNPTNY